jgi:glutamine synthetase
MSHPVETIDVLSDEGVETVRVTYPDLHGICRGTDIPIEEFGGVCEHGLHMTEAVMTVDLRHNIVAGFEHGFHDVAAHPALDSLVRLPWDPGTVWCLCDLRTIDPNEPFDQDPRNALRRASAAYSELGLTPIAAPELEFYLCEPRTYRPYVDHDSSVYVVGVRGDPLGVVRELVAACRELGLRPCASTQEYGRGQYEINLDRSQALDAADRAFRLKYAAKEIAARHGLLATFMGKLFDRDESSGFHLHTSLADASGADAFADPADAHGLSTLARQYAAGVLSHAEALCAFLNPTVNAYRRMEPDSLAPTHVNWGYDNRLALVRFPAERGPRTRAEIRAGDGTANPYLAVAAVLLAGLDGIRRRLELPEPVLGNPYELAPDRLGKPLPASLGAALDSLERDEFLREAMGSRLVDVFLMIKRFELARWQRQLALVTDWERKEYAHHL